MRMSITSILPRFDQPAPAVCGLIDFDAETLPFEAMESVDPVDEAFARGQETARHEAANELETASRRQAEAAEQALAAARAAWTEEQAERLAERLQAAVAEIEMRLSAQLASVLAPFVATAMQERMVASFADALQGIVRGDEADGEPFPPLTVKGPADLLAALEAKLSAINVAAAYIKSADVDLSVTLRDMTLRSRCDAWLEGLTSDGAAA